MARTHLRQQSGGDPAQGPVPEMANPTPSPSAGNDFPDAPEQDSGDRPSDQPDPDEFAALVGTDNITGVDGDEGSATDGPRGTGPGEIDRPHGTDVNAPVDAAAKTPDESSGTPDEPSGTTSSVDHDDDVRRATDPSGDSDRFDWQRTRDRATSGLASVLSSASNGLRRLSDRLADRS